LGDNDPIDVLEIGEKIGYAGQVKQVKILGSMALLDEGETDWKIITVDVTDPLADQLHNIADVEKLMPGLIDATRDWFQIYKVPDGKPYNNFAFNGDAKDSMFTTKVVERTYDAWKRLIAGQVPNKTDQYTLSIESIKHGDTDLRLPEGQILEPVEDEKAEITKSYFVTRK